MKLFFFDTETTGTIPGIDYIIQLGGIFGEMNEEDFSFREIYTINQLINVDVPIPEGATAIHGIRNEDLIGYDYIDKYIYKFLALVSEADYVVGHNIDFDKGMLLGEAKRMGIYFDETKVKWVDTMKPSTELVNGVGGKWPRLIALHEFLFGEGFDGAHDAMADVKATKACFLELCRKHHFYENGEFKEMIGREDKPKERNLDNIQSCNELLGKISPSSAYMEIAREDRRNNPEALKLLLTLDNGKKSVFLTGKAGTGKSTLMKGIIASCEKRDQHPVILGSTGISALNIGGQTIHSFYAMGKDSLYYKDLVKLRKVRLSKEKVELLRAAPFIIIDEVSMVHSNTIDVIDAVMKNYLGDSRPFGGKQMLFVGDIYQLPPVRDVTRAGEFGDKYKSERFFHSDVFKVLQYDVIQLGINYRQGDDKKLSGILDDIRDSRITDDDINILNECCYNDIDEDAIVLFTHKKDVALHNQQMLDKLPGIAQIITAETWKDFPDNMKPNNEEIQIKVGAKVMMVTNDQKGRWVNGSIGEVKALNLGLARPNIVVEIDGEEYEVEKYLRRYAPIRMNENGKYEEKTLGTYSQFPLQLAYAITIHKSQGLTFDECIMNIENVFVGGQAYTALSRVKSLAGLKILGRVDKSKLYFDPRVEDFKLIVAINRLWEKVISYLPHPDLCLTYTKSEYKEEDGIVLCHCYDYFDIINEDIEKYHDAICGKFSDLLGKEVDFVLKQEKREFITPIVTTTGVGLGDTDSIDKLVMKPVAPGAQLSEEDLRKKLRSLRSKLSSIEGFGFKVYMVVSNEAIDWVAKYKPCNAEQLKLMKGFGDAKIEKYGDYFIQTVINAGYSEDEFVSPEGVVVKKPKKKVESSFDKELFELLRAKRAEIAKRDHIPAFMVFHDSTLKTISEIKPRTKEELLDISGVGESKIMNYGDDILDVIFNYLKEDEEGLIQKAQFAIRMGNLDLKDKELFNKLKSVNEELLEDGSASEDDLLDENDLLKLAEKKPQYKEEYFEIFGDDEKYIEIYNLYGKKYLDAIRDFYWGK